MKFLLNTCVISELVKTQPNSNVADWISKQDANMLYLSAITWGELNRGIAKLPNGKRKEELSLWAEQLKNSFQSRFWDFDNKIAEHWGRMAAQLEKQGLPMPTFDSMIAATAHYHEALLVTRNTKDFQHTQIRLINPWNP